MNKKALELKLRQADHLPVAVVSKTGNMQKLALFIAK